MKLIFRIPLLAIMALAGCTQTHTAQNSPGVHMAYVGRPDYFKQRRTVTGSNIPMAQDQLPFSPVFATSPPESIARDVPSLYPTEPVVGASPPRDPGTLVPNVGAGPAGSNPMPPYN